jgi:hypothetical protein
MDEGIHHHPALASLANEMGVDKYAKTFGYSVLGLLEDIDDLASAELDLGLDEESESPEASYLAYGLECVDRVLH